MLLTAVDGPLTGRVLQVRILPEPTDCFIIHKEIIMSSTTASINDLFQSAQDDDIIGQVSMDALQVVDLGTKIGDALGTPADQFQQGEVVLVAVLIDDSGSIRFCGNTEVVADGHNCVIEALQDSKQQDNILFHSRLLSGKIINPFVSVDQAQKLITGTGGNFNPNSGTPLYDESVAFWGTILAKSQEFSDQGVPVRTISLILTDGADQHSTQFFQVENDPNMGQWRAPKDGVKALASDLLRQECHILAGMGVSDDDESSPYDQYATDFRTVFQRMGIRDEWIIVVKQAGRSKDDFKSEIRKQCQVFSQSAVRASQSAASFSQQAVGGFGN